MTFRLLGRSQMGLCPTPQFLFEKINSPEEQNMIEALMSVFVFLVLPVAFLVSLGKGHDEIIEGVPPYPKNK